MPIIGAMTFERDAAYLALKAHDARFDGRFFVGVTSTRHLLPPGVPRAHAAARELPLLRHAAQAEAA